MKLSVGIAAALASCASVAAAAAQQTAQVYILPSSSSSSSSSAPPAVPRSVARLILLQRLAASGKGPSVNELPDNVDVDEVVALLNEYAGPGSSSLFGKDEESTPSQLLVMLEGMTAKQMEEAAGAFDTPAFTIEDSPSAKAHEKLFKLDFYNAGLTNEHGCSLDEVVNPFKEECWSGKSTVARYDVSKDPAVLGHLVSHLKALNSLSRNGEMETTIVLAPSVAEGSGPSSWSDKPQELRRRQAEQPMAGPHADLDIDDEKDASDDESSSSTSGTSPAPAAEHPVFLASKPSIHGCFNSEDSCASATRNCSGHGQCQNKYANPDGSKSKDVCFTCHCLSTVSESGSLTHWAGGACSKKDISVPFWLFAGFTLAMVGIVSLAVGMLYGVGEEKLPGVIGAGVAKSNK